MAHDLPPGTVPHAYAPGTAEERNLRDNTRYIAPNGATVLVGVLSLLLGAIVTFIIVLPPSTRCTHAWGWLLRWQGVLVPSGPRDDDGRGRPGPAWWLPSVIAAGITLVAVRLLVAARSSRAQPPHRRRAVVGLAEAGRPATAAPTGRRLVSWAALLTVGLALAMLAAPPLISWLTTQHRIAGHDRAFPRLRREAVLVGCGAGRR